MRKKWGKPPQTFLSLPGREEKKREGRCRRRPQSFLGAKKGGEDHQVFSFPFPPLSQVKVFRETRCSGEEEEDEKLYRVPALINGLEIEVRRGGGKKKEKSFFFSGGRFCPLFLYSERRWRKKVLL